MKSFLILLVLTTLTTLTHGADSQTKSFLVSTSGPKRHFCAPMVQPITMATAQPSSFSPPCKPIDYQLSLVRTAWLPITLLVLAAVALCTTCIRTILCTSSSSSSRVSLSSSSSPPSSKAAVPRIERSGLGVGMGLVLVLAGCLIAATSSDQLHAFTFEAAAIFTDHAEYTKSVVSNLGAFVAEHNGTTANYDVLAGAGNIAQTFMHATEKYVDSLHGLDGLRSAFAFITIAAALVTPLAGLLALYWGSKRATHGLGIASFVVLGLLLINFLIMFMAANVLFDVCSTINNCHFCVVDPDRNPDVPCTACKTNFFKAMSECSDASAARYHPLQHIIEDNLDARANDVCTAIDTLCATPSVSCTRPPADCSAASLSPSSGGLTTLVCDPDCKTVAQVANASPPSPGTQNALAVLSAYASFTSAYPQLDAVESLDCSNEEEAFVESVPEGTFDRLQKHLCPKLERPVNPVQHILSRGAIGYLIASAGYVLIIIALLSALPSVAFSPRASFMAHGPGSHAGDETPLLWSAQYRLRESNTAASTYM